MRQQPQASRQHRIRNLVSVSSRILGPLLVIAMVASGAKPQQQEALGSLSSAGDVFVNAMPAPSEATIFPKDVVRTGDNGNATFTLSGKGFLKLSPNSQLAFEGDPRYLAELQSGTVVMDSFGGTTDITLRTGNFVVSPVVATEKSASRIEKAAGGSFTLYCLDGSISLIPLQGATGRVLQANQFVTISSDGNLGLVQEVSAAQPPAALSPSSGQAPTVQKSHKGLIILGIAGAGAAVGIGAAAASHGGSSGNSQAVSPSSP